MKDKRDHLYLSALLHDVGKFFQRADNGSVQSSLQLSTSIKKLEIVLLPTFQGRSSHKHCLWTAEFINKYQSVFNKLSAPVINERDKLITLSASHHLPLQEQTELGKFLKEADSLSAGMDRDSTEALCDDQDETGWDAFKRKRMTCILEDVAGHQTKQRHHIPLVSLNLDGSGFPDTKNSMPDYAQLWKRFEHDFKFIQANTYRAFAETLLSLLQKYTTAIPASTINFPDVSLYDHLKTTAAIAVCLYEHASQGEKNESPFLLIGGDLSGIQNYIYKIVSKHAAKNLKGRSFYLRLLSDAIVRYILKKLNLYQANIIYNSGGSFYILAPNTPTNRENLQSAIHYIEKHLFEAHGTQLYAAIDYVKVNKEDLMNIDDKHTLQNVWKRLFTKRDQKKNAPFASIIEQDYATFFTPHHQGGNAKRDSITGEELTDEHKEINGLRLNPLTWKQIEIGSKLKNTDYLVVSEQEIPYWNNRTNIQPIKLGITYYFITNKELQEMQQLLCASADKITVISLNGMNRNCDFMQNIDGINNIYALEFYGGNDCGEFTFEDLCEKRNEYAFSRLGILRMDVDNLGLIFQKGIPTQRCTLSRYAAMSRSFDYFFSGYINTIRQETAPDKCTIIYSGGDDVFVVGNWSNVINMAERIREDFRRYTCNNPHFTISGGVALVDDKFPIMKGAEYSGNEEMKAKTHNNGTQQKNSLSLLGVPLNWDTEFPQVKKLKDDIVYMIREAKMPKSFISKLRQSLANAYMQNHRITNFKTYWMLTYTLSRMKKETKDADFKQMINLCIKEVCDNHGTLNSQTITSAYHALELWAIAGRWAELETRTN